MRKLAQLIRLFMVNKYYQLLWSQQRARNNLDQIIWRLEMNHTAVDHKAALVVARSLYRHLYGVKAPSDTERPL